MDMKRSLKELLPAADAGVGQRLALSTVRAGPKAVSIDEDVFAARVAAAKAIAAYRDGAEIPSSALTLVRAAQDALGLSERQLRTSVGLAAALWKQVMTARVPPFVLSAQQWAALAQALRVPVVAMEGAVLGSYRQYASRGAAVHAKFARSKVKQKVVPGYAAELADAFGELRVKSAARRSVGAVDRRLSELLEGIRACMSDD
jgi:hypothetical protein